MVEIGAHRAAQKNRLLEDQGQLARRPLYVPESLNAPKVLRALQASGAQMAIVVDEHGGTAGVLTLADVVSEIMGPLPDEGDARMS